MTPAEHPILMAGPLVRAVLEGRKSVTRRLIRGLGNARHIDRLLGDWGLSEDPEPYTGIERPWRPTRQPREGDWLWTVQSDVDDTVCEVIRCPFGTSGDTLWVRETWALHTQPMEGQGVGYTVEYRADGATRNVLFDGRICPSGPPRDAPTPWPEGAIDRGGRPSIHMPRWAARLFLRVESVTVERVQDITEEDAQREGLPSNSGPLSALAGMFANKSIHEFSPGALADGLISLDTDGKADHATYRGAFACLWDSLAPAGSTWADNPWVWRVGFTRIEVNS